MLGPPRLEGRQRDPARGGEVGLLDVAVLLGEGQDERPHAACVHRAPALDPAARMRDPVLEHRDGEPLEAELPRRCAAGVAGRLAES